MKTPFLSTLNGGLLSSPFLPAIKAVVPNAHNEQRVLGRKQFSERAVERTAVLTQC